MLSEHSRKQLQIIILRFGQLLCDDPKRCEAMLKDLCPDDKREVNLLITALKEKVAHDLLNAPVTMPLELTLKNLSQRLQDNCGTAQVFAEWAVESWALSLNIIQRPLFKPILPVSALAPTVTSLSVMMPQPVNVNALVQQKIGHFIVQEGIAIDTETDLTWCRFASGQSWQNNTVTGNAKYMKLNAIFHIAKQFNRQGGYAGFTDWRLPTLDELRSLLDKTGQKKANFINTSVFPNNPTVVCTSSPYAGLTGIFWVVSFYLGKELSSLKYNEVAIRLVRSDD